MGKKNNCSHLSDLRVGLLHIKSMIMVISMTFNGLTNE
jgi:hypothetical protein